MSTRMTSKSEQAAYEVALDELGDREIAAKVGIALATLTRWKRKPEFEVRVQHHAHVIRRAIQRKGIAIVENRVAALQDRWDRMKQVIKERGASEDMQRVPGGTTGLIVHQVKGIGKGEDFQVIDIYAVDTGLLAQMLAHEQQAAKELGQWTEKAEVAVSDGGILDSLQRKFAEIAFSGQEAEVPLLPDDGGSAGS